VPKWFRFRRVGFGVTPSSPMGWILTVALVAGLWLLRGAFRNGHEPLPATFYVCAVVALVVYAGIAFMTADRER
jgi:hypothetical protein